MRSQFLILHCVFAHNSFRPLEGHRYNGLCSHGPLNMRMSDECRIRQAQ
jgi:hypothetical protein